MKLPPGPPGNPVSYFRRLEFATANSQPVGLTRTLLGRVLGQQIAAARITHSMVSFCREATREGWRGITLWDR